MHTEHRIHLRVCVEAPENSTSPLELLGEPADWLHGLPLSPIESTTPGKRWGAIDLRLPAGVHAYKLRCGHQWLLDQANPRTRSIDGRRNNVLSVGGAPEPLLFAPAPPFVHEAEDGALVVVAALRHGHGESLSILWQEPGAGGFHEMGMERVADEDEHTLLRARLPISTGRARLRFRLATGACIGPEDAREEAFLWTRSPAPAEPPSWFRDAVVYTILVDRHGPASEDAPWGENPGRDRAAGGHLDAIRRDLPRLAELGVTALYLTPIHIGATCHRYDLVDPLRVDPALGGDEAFRRLRDEAHRRGLRLILDLSFAHAGRGFFPFEHVLAHGSGSPFADWFQWSTGKRPRLMHYGSRKDAPLLNLDHPAVRAYVLAAVERWTRDGIDGLRLDMAAEIPLDLTVAIRERVRRIRPDAVVLGELVPAHAHRWRGALALDCATDFGFHDVAVDFLARRVIDARQAAEKLVALELARGAPAHTSLRFVSTHDHPRFATHARRLGPGRGMLGLFFLLASPGVPALLHGEELGLAAEVPIATPEDVWPDRMPMPRVRDASMHAAQSLVRALCALRARSPALRRGNLEILAAEEGLLVFRRAAEGEVLVVAVNVGDPVEIDIDDPVRPELALLLAHGEVRVHERTLRLGRDAAGICTIRGPAGAKRVAVTQNLARRDAELVRGDLVPGARPSRLDFALTERCNLRCAHCITQAPARTRARVARSLSPFLLERLRDDLAFAAYVGLVHGGEALVSPLLRPLLAALREARGGLPTVVHLLTNGMLLDARTAIELCGLGVNSIAVSLDGASGAVNDAIRRGGRLAVVVENLRAVVAARRAQGLDVRIGVSCVVLPENLGQLERLCEVCAEVGLDWVKLEEVVAVNAWSERARGLISAGQMREAVGAAMERARGLGLVAVDHTVERAVWRCRLEEEPEVRAFLGADEYANRSEIHPCRVPWEHACIEPDGDVKMGEFFGPVLGNLAEEELSAMWRGKRAQEAREAAIRGRLCGRGPVVCSRA
jgi:glycosidase/MoaA/NifB/PqqE/SkfB family radical SAM enzyme